MPATIYQRLVEYCKKNQRSLLGYNDKANLGRRVVKQWHNQPKPFEKLNRTQSIENTGTYTVLIYPDSFLPNIDTIIEDIYSKKPVGKIRKRIPMRQKPRYSYKPSDKK